MISTKLSSRNIWYKSSAVCIHEIADTRWHKQTIWSLRIRFRH